MEFEDDLEVVGEAKNGPQAVALVKKLRPALVLMDLVMPILNGLEATRQILQAAPATKLLILSAHSDVSEIPRAEEPAGKSQSVRSSQEAGNDGGAKGRRKVNA